MQLVQDVEGESGVVTEEGVVVTVLDAWENQARTIRFSYEQVEESLGEGAASGRQRRGSQLLVIQHISVLHGVLQPFSWSAV
jgi:hypothetical protein